MKYLKRILGLPFFLALNIIGMICMLFKIGYLFVIHGGEAIVYYKEDTPKIIADIFDELVENNKKNNL